MSGFKAFHLISLCIKLGQLALMWVGWLKRLDEYEIIRVANQSVTYTCLHHTSEQGDEHAHTSLLEKLFPELVAQSPFFTISLSFLVATAVLRVLRFGERSLIDEVRDFALYIGYVPTIRQP